MVEPPATSHRAACPWEFPAFLQELRSSPVQSGGAVESFERAWRSERVMSYSKLPAVMRMVLSIAALTVIGAMMLFLVLQALN